MVPAGWPGTHLAKLFAELHERLMDPAMRYLLLVTDGRRAGK